MKIIRRLLVVLVLGVIAGGATWSFFSDTETSSGNTFTAGKIDLLVDSQSHYNGMVCAFDAQLGKNVWQETCAQEGSNLIQNGSFETPAVTNPALWQIFSGSDITPWVAEGTPGPGDTEGLEYQKQGLVLASIPTVAADGEQYVELDSYYPIKLSQEFDAVSSGRYWIFFKYAPRPGHADNKLKVTFANTTILDVSLSASSPFGWSTFSQQVSGPTSGKVAISFEETGADDQLGMFLDNVIVKETKCETIANPALLGQDCNGTWTLDNLGSAHKFFYFTDIKPGDRGEDTISLHVQDNDAWARMRVQNIKNTENGCNEPEEADELQCNDDDQGELLQNITFTLWLDQGATPGFQGKEDEGEGNNKKEQGEPVFLENVTMDTLNAYLLHETLRQVYADSCSDPVQCPGLTADGRLVAGVTYYLGLSWQLPFSAGNEVQSDSLVADIIFDVQQRRNNSNPF